MSTHQYMYISKRRSHACQALVLTRGTMTRAPSCSGCGALSTAERALLLHRTVDILINHDCILLCSSMNRLHSQIYTSIHEQQDVRRSCKTTYTYRKRARVGLGSERAGSASERAGSDERQAANGSGGRGRRTGAANGSGRRERQTGRRAASGE